MKKAKQIIACILACLIAVSALSACGSTPASASESDTTRTRIIVDIAGDEVEIPNQVETVVNLVPFGCQIMIGLGLGEYLVGINEETIESPWIELMYPEIKTLGKGYGYAKYYTEPAGHTYALWSIEHNGRLGEMVRNSL